MPAVNFEIPHLKRINLIMFQGFDDYLRRVNDILQQKMTAISSLQEQISHYRNLNSVSQSSSVMSSVQMSVADSHSAAGSTQNIFLPQ